jgi:hypothetical protein
LLQRNFARSKSLYQAFATRINRQANPGRRGPRHKSFPPPVKAVGLRSITAMAGGSSAELKAIGIPKDESCDADSEAETL